MATSTLPDSPPEESNNPGQAEYDKLTSRYGNSANPDNQPAGNPTDPRGNDVAAGNPSDPRGEPSRQELADSEANPGTDQVGRGYRALASPGMNLGQKILLTGRGRAIAGGGVIGTILALVFGFTIFQGPLQFIHIAQLLQQFHFSSIQNQQDNRFMKEVRFVRYVSAGEIEKTRMGFLGNKFANNFETKLNGSGLSSAYTDKFGLFDGYVIDRNNETFKGMSDEQIKAYMKETYGVDVVDGSSIKGGSIAIKAPGSLVIDASNLGYTDTLKLNYNVLREAGYNKLSAAIGARLFCLRAGCNWHVLNKLSGVDIKRSVEDWLNKDKQSLSEGEQALAAEDTKPPPDKTDPNQATDTANKAAADGAVGDVSTQGASVKQGKLSIGDFRSSLSAKIAGGGAAAVGVLCMVKSVNDHADEIKQTQVILPLIRLGIHTMAVGSQLQSGQDVDDNELSQLATQLVGVDSSGKRTSWDESASINANLGKPGIGVKPNSTLTSINNGSPFDFINSVPALGAVCSTAGSIITGIISIGIDATGIGAVITNIGGGLAASIAANPLLDQIAQWLSGNAVDMSAVGADFGNNIDYGAALAANGQNITAGGSQLSKAAAANLLAINNNWTKQQFNKQNVIHKLFSPTDENSAIATLIDNTSSSFTQNVSMMGSAFLNVGKSFGGIAKLFTPQAKAATAGYDYGFPIYGFSEQDMNNPLVENPYDNACHVVGCPNHVDPNTGQAAPIAGILADSNGNVTPTGQSLINRAKSCFGVDIGPDASGNNWNVTLSSTDPTSAPNPYGSKANSYSAQCDDSSDNWTRLRFFILDTETMNSMGCYAGDDGACNDVGLSSASSPATPPPGGGTPGTYQDPFRDIKGFTPQRIDMGVDYDGSGPIYALGNGKVNYIFPGWCTPAQGGCTSSEPLLAYTLSDGPAAGKTVYVAECITPAVQPGQSVTSSTVIAQMTNCGNGIETGWGTPTESGGLTMANPGSGSNCFDGTHSTAFGQNFSDLIKSLGGIQGVLVPPVSCTLPQGWPTW